MVSMHRVVMAFSSFHFYQFLFYYGFIHVFDYIYYDPLVYVLSYDIFCTLLTLTRVFQ